MAVQSHPVQNEGMRGDIKAALSAMYSLKITEPNGKEAHQRKQIKHTYTLEFAKSSAPTC